MILMEAIKALSEGKKIRRKTWQPQEYIRLNKDGQLIDELGGPVEIFFDSDDIKEDNWKFANKPILTYNEKEYLENLIRPFRKRFERTLISKETFNDNFVLTLYFRHNDKENPEYSVITFPSFSKQDRLYTGMEEEKLYSRDELGLFGNDD
nr:MAG TPA: Protein of unknown function (DUF2829) [Caudoviricetes sp.]